MAVADCFDPDLLPQSGQERRQTSPSAGDDAAHSPASHCYSLNTPAMEEALIEVPTMRCFTGIELISDRIPDESTILIFCHRLEKHKLSKLIFRDCQSPPRFEGAS